MPDYTQIGSTGVYYRYFNRMVEIRVQKSANVTNQGVLLATLPNSVPAPPMRVQVASGNTLDPAYPAIVISIDANSRDIKVGAWSTVNNVTVVGHLIYLA